MSTPSEGLLLLRRLEVPEECPCPAESRKPLACGCDLPCPCGKKKAKQHCCGETCDCPVLLPPPCKHVLRRAHGLSLPEWAALLMAFSEASHKEPPPPTSPVLALTRKARVAIYRTRRRAKLHIYHPRDAWRRQPTADGVKTGIVARRVANGYMDPEQELAVVGKVGPEPVIPPLVDELVGEMGEGQRERFFRARGCQDVLTADAFRIAKEAAYLDARGAA